MRLYLADREKQFKVKEPKRLSLWMDEQFSSRPWESLGISETRYLVSLIPLFNSRVLNREENAKRLGISYGALRNFLTERRVKRAATNNINGYAKFSSGRLMRKLQSAHYFDKRKQKITEIKLRDFEDFIDEAYIYYAVPLLMTISGCLYEQTKVGKDLKIEAAKISYCRILDAIGLRYKQDGETERYQKIRLQQLEFILLNMEEYLKGNKHQIGKAGELPSQILDLGIKQVGYATKLANEMFNEIK